MKQLKKEEYTKDLNIEHNLLVESADREEKLTNRTKSLEIELIRSKQEVERLYLENEKILVDHQELLNLNEQLKDNMLKQRSEIKSLKERENRLLVDNTDLDGENVQLQEQIVRLKEDLVELDTVRHENKALEEKLETLESQIIELSTLKRIVEKQLEESLNSFREEREHKYQRKRESHERREKQSLQELKNLANNLAESGTPSEHILYDEIDIDDDDDLHNKTDQMSRGSSSSRNSQEPVGGSLFSEIHSNELQVLEKNIEELNKHKENLENELFEFKTDLNVLVKNMHTFNKKLPVNQQDPSKIEVEMDLLKLDENKPSKHALTQFDKLKNELDAIFLNYSKLNEARNQEDLNKKLDDLKLDNTFLIDNLVSLFNLISKN